METRAQVILSGFADEGAKPAREQLTMLAALGMSYYSVRFVDLGSGVKNAMQLDKTEVRQLVQLHREFGMQVASLGSPIGKVKLLDLEDGSHNRFVPFGRYLKEEVGRAIDLAGALGTKLIRGFSFYHPRGTTPEVHLEQAAANLRRIAEKCGEAGVFFGLEVEANLVGQNGRLLARLHRLVDHAHLLLVFDGGNLSSQNLLPDQTYAEYRAMRQGLGWMHIKDYRIDPGLKWQGFVDEERLKNFVPADQGDSAHEAILRDFRQRLPALERRLKRLGLPGVFLDLEPHLKGGGQFGGYSGPDGFGVALRSLLRLLDYVGIDYRLTTYRDIERQKK
ncbi:MAG: sugar phosphate isomerase/epimerase [Candidatus Latescibacteria bacterium]|nr:sugar phosphate isomerase/epimerase [Candidatus Latescibacterota bacterium]